MALRCRHLTRNFRRGKVKPIRLAQVLAVPCLFADHGAPVALHRRVARSEQLRRNHSLDFVFRPNPNEPGPGCRGGPRGGPSPSSGLVAARLSKLPKAAFDSFGRTVLCLRRPPCLGRSRESLASLLSPRDESSASHSPLAFQGRPARPRDQSASTSRAARRRAR
jgi:hypothetical protein